MIVERTWVRNTRPTLDNLFGDGIALSTSNDVSASGAIAMSVIESNARTGFSNFGCTASLRSSTLRCRPFHLIAEPWQSFSPVTQDGGGNACGCPESGEGCRIMSAQLTPPQAM